MERLCRQDAGLFPKPSEIRFSCTCPDFASMCKHVAAALYGVGARLDHKPELLFRLRVVNETELVADIDVVLPMSRKDTGSDKILQGGDLSVLFGLEMAAPPAIEEVAIEGAADDARPPRSRRAASASKRAPPTVKAAASRKRDRPACTRQRAVRGLRAQVNNGAARGQHQRKQRPDLREVPLPDVSRARGRAHTSTPWPYSRSRPVASDCSIR